MSEIIIDKMKPPDWEVIRSIYAEGIATGIATFETEAPDWAVWDKNHLGKCRLVARLGGTVVGWAALSPISERCVYGGVAEVSVYVREGMRGRGIGRTLLERLIEESEQCGIWTLQAGMFPENIASIDLHESCGFRQVGLRERIGKLNAVWWDVVLMERRSQAVK